MKTLFKMGAAALLATSAGSALAQDAGTEPDYQWGTYHWEYDGNAPLTLNVSYKFSSDATWLGFHEASLSLWNDHPESMLNLVNGGEATHTSSKRCTPIRGEIVVCADKYGQRGWVGIAEINASGDHITQAVVKYNDTYYAYAFYNNDEQRDFVTCHEVGHTLGLGHEDVTFDNPNHQTCMDYTEDPYGNSGLGPYDNSIPGPSDWTILNSSTAYGHSHDGGTDPGPDPDPTPCRGGPKKCGNGAFAFREVGQAAPAYEGPYGRAVGYDGQGRPNEFVQDLGAGNRKITFIMWARGYRPEGSLNR